MHHPVLVDPWQELGLSPKASTTEIRARYAELVKRHPPDRDPERFERIRDAYRQVRDPQSAARRRVLGPPPLHDLDELRQALAARPLQPVSVDAWLAVAKERRQQRRGATDA